MSDPGNITPEEAEIARLNEEMSRMRQRSEESLKCAILVGLERWPSDERANAFARISAQILEKLSRGTKA